MANSKFKKQAKLATKPKQNQSDGHSKPTTKGRPAHLKEQKQIILSELSQSKPTYTLSRPLPPALFIPGKAARNQTLPQQAGPLLLHLTYSISSAQHAALDRISTFCESRDFLGKYLSLKDICSQNLWLCRGYVGFNVPLESVKMWLTHMWEIEVAGMEPEKIEKKWWIKYCNPDEVELLDILIDKVGLLSVQPEQAINDVKMMGLDLKQQHISQEDLKRTSKDPRQPIIGIVIPYEKNQSLHGSLTSPYPYIISQLSNFPKNNSGGAYSHLETATHELAHFAYHSSPLYQTFVNELYQAKLSKITRLYIQTLLISDVGYAEHVCVDEWQAYLVAEGEQWLLPGNGCFIASSWVKRKEKFVQHLATVKGELQICREILRGEWKRLGLPILATPVVNG
ncbi:hypothetical protein BDZ91DRAFT_766247 [Kalaharituber pfeilii]|nr:hypothetical protein BDZ91DRAFT_766247 [Kalaharituber pfeilii]